jgi:hypothetical protein
MVDDLSESSSEAEADDCTKPGMRGSRPRVSESTVGSHGSRVGAMRSLNPLLFLSISASLPQ